MADFLSDCAGPEPGPETLILRVGSKNVGEVDGYILNDSLEGWWTHWDGRYTQPCTKVCEGDSCRGHEHGHALRWKGYLHIFCIRRNRAVYVELTPAAKELLWRQVPKDKSLRGLRIHVRRSGQSVHGRVIVTVNEYAQTPEKLPAFATALPALKKLWRIKD